MVHAQYFIKKHRRGIPLIKYCRCASGVLNWHRVTYKQIFHTRSSIKHYQGQMAGNF